MAADTAVSRAGGEVIASGVTFEDYLERFAGQHVELEYGNVVKMSPIHERHDQLSRYLAMLLEAYFAMQPIGTLRQDPFVMKSRDDLPVRQPDLQIILKTGLGRLTPTYTDGPADIVIEIVSPGSEDMDRGTKFVEYQKGGVPEYWIIDPVHRECLFYRLDEDGIYVAQPPDAAGSYFTGRLPGFRLSVPVLWSDPLPGFFAIGEMVKAMLA